MIDKNKKMIGKNTARGIALIVAGTVASYFSAYTPENAVTESSSLISTSAIILGIIFILFGLTNKIKSAEAGHRFMERSERREKRYRNKEKEDLNQIGKEEYEINNDIKKEEDLLSKFNHEDQILNNLIKILFHRSPQEIKNHNIVSKIRDELNKENNKIEKLNQYLGKGLKEIIDIIKKSKDTEKLTIKEARTHINELTNQNLSDEEKIKIHEELKLEKKENNNEKDLLVDEEKIKKDTKSMNNKLSGILNYIKEQIKILNSNESYKEKAKHLWSYQKKKEELIKESLKLLQDENHLLRDAYEKFNLISKYLKNDIKTSKKLKNEVDEEVF